MSTVLSEHLPLLASARDGIQKLRGLILELAVRGKLVPQDPDDEPASELLKRIGAQKKSQSSNEAPRPLMLDLPAGWSATSLNDYALGVFTGPFGSVLHQSDYTTGGIPLVNPSHMINDKIVPDDRITVSQDVAERLSSYRLAAGDIVMARRGEVGRAALVAVSQAGWLCGTGSFFLNFSSEVNRNYLLLVLRSGTMRTYLSGQAVGTTMVNLNHGILKRAPLAIPPLPEQHRIVAKVDELMALCDRLEAEQADAASAHARLVETLLGTLTQSTDAADLAANWQRLAEHFDTLFTTEASIDALKQTVLQLAVMGKLVPRESRDEPVTKLLARIAEARRDTEGTAKKRTRAPISVDVTPPFKAPGGWAWRRLDELLTISSGITLGKNYQDRTLVSRPYLRVANVQRGYLALEQIKTIEIPVEDVDRYRLRSRDLLITEGGDWDKVGRTAIWSEEIEDCLHQNHVFRARPLSSEWNVRWTEMFLNSVPARTYFAGASKQTTNLASINMTQLKACAFPVPPLAEQHRIVAKVDELMALCDRLKTDLATARQHEATLADTLIDTALEAA